MLRLGSRLNIGSVSFIRQGFRFNHTANDQQQQVLKALKSKNRLNPDKKLNTTPYNLVNSTVPSAEAQPKAEFKSFVEASELRANPKDVANQLRVTGPRAGRIVKIINHDVDGAFRALQSVVRTNNIRGDLNDQRFYLKPGKARELKSIRKNKKEFMKSFRRMMQVVKDASRRGY